MQNMIPTTHLDLSNFHKYKNLWSFLKNAAVIYTLPLPSKKKLSHFSVELFDICIRINTFVTFVDVTPSYSSI